MRTVLALLRPPLRSLASHRGATLVALLTLALTIGLSTAVFSIVNGVVLRPLPFRDPERVIALCEVERGTRSDWCGASVPNAYDIASRSRTIATVGVARSWPFLMKLSSGSVGVSGGLATGEAFEALGITPYAGRLITRDDIGTNWRRVVVLSYELWRTRFGSRPDVIGQAITLDDEPHTIVGILPPNTRLPQLEDVEIWRPVHVDPNSNERRDWRGFLAFARLRDNATVDEARTEVASLAASIQRDYFPSKPGWGMAVRPWLDVLVSGVRQAMFIFLGAVGFLVLIGCANVANILLAQATVREREMAVRAAVGAGRGTLLRGLLLESLLLSVAGAASGLAIAWAVTRAFIQLAPRGIPRVDEVGVDGRVLLFTALVSVVTTLLAGAVPALRATRVDLNRVLTEGGRSGTGRRANHIAALLIVGEMAMAVVLVTGAGLLGRSFATLLSWRPGFEQDHLVTVWTFTSPGKFTTGDQLGSYLDRAEAELRSIPSVVSVGTGSAGPLFGGDGEMSFRIDGRPVPNDGPRQATLWYDVSPGYFRTFGIPMVRGRDIERRDVYGGPKVAVVNERFARQYLGDQPLGRRIYMVEHEAEFEVVGVVADVPPLRPGDEVPPQIFWSNRQVPRPATYFIVRTASAPGPVMRVIADRLHAADPDMQVSQLRTMREVLARQLIRPRFGAVLLGSFAMLALLLAAVGTYGLFAYTVEQRAKEFGIRLALGARPSSIVGGVAVRAVRLAGLAVGVGVIASLALTRFLSAQLAGVKPNDPATFAVSVGVLMVVAIVASLVPAARASRVDPVVTLRAD